MEKIQILEAWEHDFIARQAVARLATVDTSCRPHIVPVVFAFNGQQLFTPIDRKPKRVGARQLQRVRNIRNNPQVTVLFDEYSDDWNQLAWVQIRGRANFIEAGPERDLGITLLAAKYPQYKDQSVAGQPVIVIIVENTISWRADTPSHTPQG